MIKVLFVCSQNRLRSPTAEQGFSTWPGIECESASVHDLAAVPLDPELIEWADIIVAMETAHRTKMARKFKRHLSGKRVVVLGIPDDYAYMDPRLIELLEKRVPPLLIGNSTRSADPR